MQIPINEELKTICREIITENLSLESWAMIESDDQFQTSSFEGGFDSTANKFVFSYYGDKEYWFQLTLEQVKNIYDGKATILTGTIAEW